MVTKSSSPTISIFEGQTIGAVQEFFTGHYPFLKIDFFKNLDLNGVRATKKLDLRYGFFSIPATEISVSASRTIQSLKHEFNSTTGLLVKVFRKSGSVWIETSLTDDWTLERQNEEGKSMTN